MARTGKKISISLAALCMATGLIALMPSAALAQGKLTAVVTPNPVEESESFQLRIEISNPEGAVFQPNFDAPDFTTMGSSSVGSSGRIEIVNGQQTLIRNYQYTFVLMPKKVGNFTIQNISVRAGSDTLKSEDIRVKVIPDSGNPKPRARNNNRGGGIPGFPGFGSLFDEDDDESAVNPAAPPQNQPQPQPNGRGALNGKVANELPRFNSDFTVVALVNKQKVYVGEPIVVEYYLYDYGGVRACCEIQKWPTFNGFVKDDLEITSRFEFEDVYVGNQLMRRVFIGRYALYSLKPGKYSLDKMQVKAKYLSDDNMSGNVFQVFDLRTGMHASQDVNLEIMPLPEAGRPANFGGAVGQFTMKLEADKLTLPQNTPLTLNLTFQGSGNFQAIDSVKLPLPPDFELYESNTNSRGSAPLGVRRELESQKSFQTVAIPRKAGKFEIPALHWSYFNPKKLAYETLSTQPISIEVTENNNASSNQNSYVKPTTPTADLPNPDLEFRALKAVVLGAQQNRGKILNGALILLGALNAWLLARFVRKKMAVFGRLYRNMDPFATARGELASARRAPGSNWQSSVEDAIFGAQNVLLKMNTRGLTKYELEENWNLRGLPLPLYQRIQKVLQELDRSRFSSTKQTSANPASFRERVLAEAESLLKEAARAQKKSK
ncbi:MAG: BatD family protein [Bdellovibrionota bacterium]